MRWRAEELENIKLDKLGVEMVSGVFKRQL